MLNLEKIPPIHSPYTLPQNIKEHFCVPITWSQTNDNSVEITVEEKVIDRDALNLRILKEKYPDKDEAVLEMMYKWYKFMQEEKAKGVLQRYL